MKRYYKEFMLAVKNFNRQLSAQSFCSQAAPKNALTSLDIPKGEASQKQVCTLKEKSSWQFEVLYQLHLCGLVTQVLT